MKYNVVLTIVVLIAHMVGCQIDFNNNSARRNTRQGRWRSKQRSNTETSVTVEAGRDKQTKGPAGCPESSLGVPFVYHEETGKCYYAGTQGPCGENMRIFPQKGTRVGYCDCNCDAYLDPESRYHSPRQFCTGRTENGEFRSLAYVKRWNSCQPLLEQGKCESGHWLAFGNDSKQGPFCERAVCEILRYDLKFYDSSTSKCERVGASCRTREGLEGSYQIIDSDWMPQCVVMGPEELNLAKNEREKELFQEMNTKGQAASMNILNCPSGFFYSMRTRSCRRRMRAIS